MSEEQPETQDVPAVPTPDESAYNAMETEAAAAGPAAEARRKEMAKWSDATGAYAEAAAVSMARGEELAVNRTLGQEGVEAQISAAAHRIAENGVRPYVDRHDKDRTVQRRPNAVYLKPTEQGITEKSHGQEYTYRSPAHINEPIEPQAPEAPAPQG